MQKTLLFIIGFFSIYSLVIGVYFPIVEHDSLVYATEAKIIARDRSFDQFMSLSMADPITGFYNGSFQIPALQSLYAWIFLVTGDDRDFVIRAISPLFNLYTLTICFYIVVKRYGKTAALSACFILITTPIFIVQGYENSQDPTRINLLFTALIFFALAIEQTEKKVKTMYVVFASSSLGLALFLHLLTGPAIVAVGLLALVYWIKGHFNHKNISTALILILFFSFPYYYISNKEVTKKLYGHFYTLTQFFESEDEKKLRALRAKQRLMEQVKKHELDSESLGGTAAQYIENLDKKVDKEKKPIHFLLETRGQGDTLLANFVLGKMQIFTAPFFFGVTFYLFLLSLLKRDVSIVNDQFARLLLLVFLSYWLTIIFDIRRLAWSNPRYIGTCVFIAAYFGGVTLAEAITKKKWLSIVCVTLLLIPLLSVVAVKGSKVGITNRGMFIKDFYSLKWIDALTLSPRESIKTFTTNYLGVSKVITYFFSEQGVKLAESHEHFKALEYFNHNYSDGVSKPLVFKNGQYYYYSKIPGAYYAEPKILRLYNARYKKGEVMKLFEIEGITHIIVDEKYMMKSHFRATALNQIVNDSTLSKVVYSNGLAHVFELIHNNNVN